jgi:hypothetical protein
MTRQSRLIQIQKEDAANEELVIRNLMSTPAGRRWVWLFLSAASLFAESEHFEPYRLAYEKGQRRIGHLLLASVTRHTPREYIKMTEEATNISLSIPDIESQDD